jgi:hypothetical protein
MTLTKKNELSTDDAQVLSLLDEAARQYQAYVYLTGMGSLDALQGSVETWKHDPDTSLSLTVETAIER